MDTFGNVQQYDIYFHMSPTVEIVDLTKKEMDEGRKQLVNEYFTVRSYANLTLNIKVWLHNKS